MLADFNQVHQTLLDLSSSFDEMPDRLVVLWRIEDVFGPALTTWVVGRRRPRRPLGTMSGSWVRWSVRRPTDSGLPVVVGIPPVPEPAWLDPLDTRSSIRLAVLHGQLVEAFLDGLGRGSRDARRPRRAGPRPRRLPGPTTPATT